MYNSGARARPGHGPAIMRLFRLLASRRFRRRAVSTITASATPCGGDWGPGEDEDEDEGPFFDLDLSCCSAPASSAESSSESEESCAGEVDFVISLHRSCSASPCCERVFFGGGGGGGAWSKPPPMKFCASEPGDAAAAAAQFREGRRGKLRTLSFGSAAKAAFYGGRASFSRSSCSARLFDAACEYGSPDQDEAKRPPSGDLIRRCLSKIKRRLRRKVAPSAAASELRLRKSRSASAAQTSPPPPREDDSLFEKQDGISSAIAHCKESLHRASMSSECDSSLLRSRSDPGT